MAWNFAKFYKREKELDKGFSTAWIDELKLKNDIVSVISKYSNLQKKGKTWWTCCPFHFEKTPSFAVNEYDQYYKCFGCGASGDVIKFIEKIESCDFYDACKILAKNANMEMPEFTNDENVAKLKQKKDLCLKILKDTANYYYVNLRNPQSKQALNYIDSRGLNADTIKSFGVGYSLGWNELIDYLKSKGYSLEDMETAGVIEKKNGKYYDALAKRLVFPVVNSYGDVVGFSARVLEKVDFAKYKNTSQTIAFDKSKCVYNIFNIKKQKQNGELKEIIIVEGQMDVISLYSRGIKNAVACMGTALTNFHAKEMKKFTDRVVVCFDGDDAGKKATLRSLDILVNAGLNVYVANLPDGMDPDEYVQKFGKSQFEQLIEGSLYWVEYLIREFAEKYNLNKVEEKNKFVNDALGVIKKLSTESEKNIYLEIVKDISNINMSVLKADLEAPVTKDSEDEKTIIKEENIFSKENAYIKAVKFVLSALLHKKEYAYLIDNFKDYILNPDYVIIYNYIEEQIKNGNKPIVSTIFNMFDDVENNIEVTDIINYNFVNMQDNLKYYEDCLKLIRNTGLQIKQKELTEKLSNTKDLTERVKVAQELQEIILKIKG